MRSPVVALVGAVLVAIVAGAQAPPATTPAEPALPPQFEVEVIVFANRDFDPTEERFDQHPEGFDGATETLRAAPVFDDTNFGAAAAPADALAPPADALPPLDPLAAQRAEALSMRPLGPQHLKLGNEYRKLRASAGYTPLVHAGWVQPGLPEDDAQPFDLGVLGSVNPSGTIRVHLSARNFLHVTLDLAYQADSAAAPVVTSDGLDELVFAPRYHLTATRTVRSGELHYFDHPAFGVLVRVTPVPTADSQGRRPAA